MSQSSYNSQKGAPLSATINQKEANQMKHIEQRSTPFELKREPDADGSFEGYASLFDVVDQGMDSVAKGAFAKSLAVRKPKMLWQHDPTKVIGIWESVQEDERGLFVKGRILKDVAKGAEAMALLRAGALDGLSIGYRTINAMKEGNGSVRKLLEVDLFEISLVTFPMLPSATISSVKSIETIRDFEKALRDVGFSQSQAKAIAADGFKGLSAHRDDVAGTVDNEGLKALHEQLTQLQETLK